MTETLQNTSRIEDSRFAETPLPPPDPARPFGRYRLVEQIGAGGFSVVWKAQDCTTGETVALKLPRVPSFISHLRREALIASRFQDAQVVGIREIYLDHDPPFLVMPYIPGTNLELPDRAPAPTQIISALRRFRKIAEVVARLHAAEIVHGDLKPGNIRFDPQGVCYILDLGLARHQVAARQNSTLRASVFSVTGEKIAGTLEFMAPEVLGGARPDKRADVYALGVILHALLCGRPPAFGVSPEELNPYLPPGMTDFLRQLLHQDPALRPACAGDLLSPVDAFIRAEERCLRRRNGHARRLIFRRRMRALARGIKVLAGTATLGLLVALGLPPLESTVVAPELRYVVLPLFVVVVGFIGLLLAITTINAWVLGIPERMYKKRSGHPWWSFMMQ